jgi:HEAT repeat protein
MPLVVSCACAIGLAVLAIEVRLKADTTSEVRLKADTTSVVVAYGFSRTYAQAASTGVADLKSPDRDTRLRAVRLLKDAGHPDSAGPLVPLIGDPDDEIQYEAIGAELNAFLAEKIVSKRRVGGVVELRNRVVAEGAFTAGVFALGPDRVPPEVMSALLSTVPDDNAYVGMEALYAFGALAPNAAGPELRDLLTNAALEFAAFVGASEPAQRVAALRVIGRVFARQPSDPPAPSAIGDAVVIALNDQDRLVRSAASATLGSMRYERAVQALLELFQHYRRGTVADELLDALARIGHSAARPAMAAALQNGSAARKRAAVEGLARMNDAAALAAAEQSLSRDRSESLRLARAFAAARLGSGGLDEIVNALTRSALRDQAFGYLIELAPGRAAAFGRHAQDPDAAIRRDIADALGVSGDPAARPIVDTLVRDGDARVSQAAARAATRLGAARRPS